MRLHPDVLFALSAITVVGLPLLYFYRCNGDSLRVERFFYEKHFYVYKLLQFILFFLMLNIAIYTRVIIFHYIDIANVFMIGYVKKYK